MRPQAYPNVPIPKFVHQRCVGRWYAKLQARIDTSYYDKDIMAWVKRYCTSLRLGATRGQIKTDQKGSITEVPDIKSTSEDERPSNRSPALRQRAHYLYKL